MTVKRLVALISAGALALSISACAQVSSKPAESTTTATGKDKLVVVATTGYLGDAVANIAPQAELTVLVGPGGDPHTQELTTSDTEKIGKADLVVWTSHDMEHKMMDQLDKLGDRQLAAGEAIPESQLLPWEENGKIEGHDPHVWNDPVAWQLVVTATAEKLAKIDPDNADTYKANAKKYNEKIQAVHVKAKEEFAKIPKERRVLVTGHDAFNYLGRTYDLEIHATDFVSSESEMSPVQINELAQLVAKKKVPVIFADNLKNPEVIKHLREAVAAAGWNVKIADTELFADTLGTEAPVDTYVGAFKHNVEAIVAGLK
ncbi:metal ABC transporter substrate-binding protein [Trueperella pyogenes]|uniref:Zinc ABC transporter substrate-binding protein n=1 Tax=Trueperella pyogenes TaxID=1661 RepID=A0A3S9QJU1_9ACTO|nr:zinc ABC transporter substrate-binding protein [Trueperella pyogenes]AWG04558.1 zinc ABC transporter substrate-binding protein [Trueperella pyogenes]AWG15387.1 zinc ABC transporter substrate-binding protein [Trueperella pyogenes]AZR04274.1 zinc ABC transporter substrate-binding protein [Trueperella pyogenes]AZR06159.1 zinc ABC transporter substrate-binding protein [Trueperella pyogenes]